MNKSISFWFYGWIVLFFLSLTPLEATAENMPMTGKGCDPENPNTGLPHPNLNILKRLNVRNLDASRNIIADDFIWHYFNPRLPELHGDYHGIDGFKEFFVKLHEISSGSFQSNVIDRSVVGDELVIVQTCNRLALEAFDGDTIETKVIVVWRIVNGRISEGWDIPSIYNVRIIENN